jgi:hypothetical protein
MKLLKTAPSRFGTGRGGALSASAQSGSSSMNGSSAATSMPSVSAQTHCRDANGNVQLKSAGPTRGRSLSCR